MTMSVAGLLLFRTCRSACPHPQSPRHLYLSLFCQQTPIDHIIASFLHQTKEIHLDYVVVGMLSSAQPTHERDHHLGCETFNTHWSAFIERSNFKIVLLHFQDYQHEILFLNRIADQAIHRPSENFLRREMFCAYR